MAQHSLNEELLSIALLRVRRRPRDAVRGGRSIRQVIKAVNQAGRGYSPGFFQERTMIVIKTLALSVVSMVAWAAVTLFCHRIGIPSPVIYCLIIVIGAAMIYLGLKEDAKVKAAVTQATAAAEMKAAVAGQALNECW